jgi:two-component system sensor histidine kinase ChiS
LSNIRAYMMTKLMAQRQTLLVTILFLIILTGIRLLWNGAFMTPEHPHPIQGRLDLQQWDFTNGSTLSLDGEWEFYPHTFLIQEDAARIPKLSEKGSFIHVPGNWGSALAASSGLSPDYVSTNGSYGYGSYRLRIAVPPDSKQIYAVQVSYIASSSQLYVNGKLVGQSGYPAASKTQYQAQNLPYSASFTVEGGEIELVIQAANFDYPSKGGISGSLKFGYSQAVDNNKSFSISMQVLVISVLLMHAIYACLLYLIGTREKALIYFFLLVASGLLITLTSDNKLLLIWLDVSLEWTIKLSYLAMLGSATFLFIFVRHLLPEYSAKGTPRWFIFLYAAATLFILLTPGQYILLVAKVYLVLYLFPFIIVPILALRSVIKGDHDAIFLLLGITAISANVVWGWIKTMGAFEMGFYPLDFIITFFAFASYWFKRHFRIAEETKQLSGKLQMADKQKDDFLANTSHELRNPLHGILNIAQVVLDSEKDSMGEKNTENMELLISIGRRMSFLLNDLQDLTRLKEKGIHLQVANVQIQAAASGVIDMLRFVVEGKPIRFFNNIPESFPPVLADENRLIQILFNLLHNALKYTNEGSIRIDSEIRKDMAYIRITDTGVGMDEETLQKIFKPYEQGHAAATMSSGGIGLGLSICKQLVELHGGTLEASSVQDSGSVFSFTLQLAEPSVQQDEAIFSSPVLAMEAKSLLAVAVEPPGVSLATGDAEDHSASLATGDTMGDAEGHSASLVTGDTAGHSATTTAIITPTTNTIAAKDRPRVLAVDDDSVNLMILKEILTSEAYDIATATSGADALALLDSREWDLVIADVMMPQMSGYELAHSIRSRFSISELPILLLTARSRPEDIEAGFLSGANDYVTKPMESMELLSRTRALTALKKSVREQLRIEAACLQAQIQPHFLFNTLNSIAALSEIDTSRMSLLLGKFGHYLRASFDFQNLERLVPLSRELDLIHSYLFIEKERFENRLNIVWDVEDNLTLHIPPLSIQPLVENAVMHGILMRPQGGTLQIRITGHADYGEISVIDNGVGMDEKTLQRILANLSDKGSGGIGLRNTDRRLKQIYGKGLHIESKPGVGTTITFMVYR